MVEAAANLVMAAPAARCVAFVRCEIEDLENHDRLGVFGLGRLSALRAELYSAEVRTH